MSTPTVDSSKVLANVSAEHGFHFTLRDGVYSGTTATSLEDFASKLETADADSILFHYKRGDFQKWIDDTLGDTELANRLCFINPKLSGNPLRKQLIKNVKKIVNELQGPWLSRPTTP